MAAMACSVAYHPSYGPGPGSTSNAPPADGGAPNNPDGGARPLFLGGEAVSAAVPPPPLSGGTLLAGRKSPSLAFASNPDADIVDVVDIDQKTLVWSAALGAGSEPGRLVEDDAGHVHVVLRRAGAIATLDVAQKTVTKRAACPAPRGITADSTSVWVVCAGGELVELPLDGSAAHVHVVERDLRDIVFGGDGKLHITRFRSAEEITLDPASTKTSDGTVLSGIKRAPLAMNVGPTDAGPTPSIPHVAWRMVVGADGVLYELHQSESTRPIDTTQQQQQGDSPYGGMGIPPLVLGGVSRYSDGLPVASMILPPSIDIAVSPAGLVAIAVMPPQQIPNQVFIGTPGQMSGPPAGIVMTPARPVAVAFATDSSGRLLIQTREPAQLVLASPPGGNPMPPAKWPSTAVALSPNIHDTGFAIFTTPTSAGIACMSCHPEGGDDGHAWQFTNLVKQNVDVGLRRTQSMRGGVLATAPFHWNGDMKDLSALAHEVFMRRMGGDTLSDAQIDVLG